MLDVRLTAYVCPIAEQPFESLTPVVRVSSYGDESATITGLVRIYRKSTGLLLYTSELAVTSLAGYASAEISALTPWDPPAPADDDYFCLCDILAVSLLHSEDQLRASLGAFTFDIKGVPMGEAPPAHHVTHEAGGSDWLTVTALPGLLADPQTPLAHAATHADGGGDDVDHNTLDNLTVGDPHTQYRLRHEIFYEDDFLYPNYGPGHAYPWLEFPIATGTVLSFPGTALHPGVYRIVSSTSANSGRRFLTHGTGLLCAGGETSRCYHRPQTLAGTTRHHGFHDTTVVADPSDGAWIWQDPADGKIWGRTMSNSVGSTTGTGYQLVTNTWYIEKIVVNADATRVDYYLYNEAGALLWTDFLTTNIPTAANRELGHGVVATNSGTTAVALDDIDFLSILIPDRRPNV